MQMTWILLAFGQFFPLILQIDGQDLSWRRSALIYHVNGRTAEGMKKNFIRVAENGDFTGQLLFDHAILTASSSNGRSTEYGPLEGKDFTDLLCNLRNDANLADSILQGITLPKKVPVSIGIPYIDSQDRTVSINGQNYRLSNFNERLKLMQWYVSQVNDWKRTGNWKSIEILGLYYHREDIIDYHGDEEYVRFFNKYVHSIGMQTIWVPYYNAPHAWEGKQFGFDVEVVQPGYSFASSIDRGSVTGDRLYAIGRKSATVGQCFEYELRGGGIDPVEYWIAHQYLAIAQETGAWKFSQVFFTGSDYFDKISGKQNTPANAWLAYTDLTNYLTGQNISNWEIRIPFSINNYDPVTQTLTKKWTVSTEYAGLSSIRLDFSDIWGYWRGKVTVRVGEQSSFSVRLGQDPLDPTYNAVTVPLADKNITSGMTLQIDLEKEKDSAWPSIIQLVGAKYEPLYLANPLYEEISSASVSVFTSWNHADVVPTHKQFAAGKLTDGKINPDFWYWNSTVGWYQIPEGRFNIMIDLGSARQGISQVKLYSHREPRNIVYLATKLTALISSQCQPQSGGTLGLSCLPEASSVEVKTDKIGNGDGYLLTLPFNNVTARYVSVSGVPQGWFLLDEVEIVGNLGTVLSRGKPYRVTPIPGEVKTSPPYPDDGKKLVDGSIFKTFVSGMRGVVGISRDDAPGQVEVVWDSPRTVRCAKVWMTESLPSWGILLPAQVSMQTRDDNGIWQNWVNVTPTNCGPSPCASLCFNGTKQVTGVSGSFSNLKGWAMVTEITVE